MDEPTIFSIVATIILLIVMVSAAVSDWRKREVSDTHWAVMGGAGIFLFTAYSFYLYGFRWEFICLALASVMALADILLDKEWNPLLYYLPMALLFLVPIHSAWDLEIMAAWASIPVCYLIFVALYLSGIFHGGADVKCLT